jgi:hypothetical protein
MPAASDKRMNACRIVFFISGFANHLGQGAIKPPGNMLAFSGFDGSSNGYRQFNNIDNKNGDDIGQIRI